MLNLFKKYLSNVFIDIKGVIKLYFSYPIKYKTSKLQSILPKSAEKLVQEGVNIAENVHISSHLNYLGKEVYIGWDTRITQCLSIGNFTSISNGVKIGLTNHALDHIGTSPLFYAKRRGWVDQDTFSEEGGELVTIGADVLISANVIVLKGIKIGTGAVVGAGSVVTKDIPPYAIVAGVPAKVIKYRFNEVTIDRLIKSEWWNLPNNLIKQHKAFFKNVDEFLTRIGK